MSAVANAIVGLASIALAVGALAWLTLLPAIGFLWLAGWLQ